MKDLIKEKITGGNFLFAMNIFIAFILLFEDKLAVPQWLQPLGRMHPLVLHFPIVLLLLAVVMELFRFKTGYRTNDFYQRFTSGLLLTGVISAGITVIMGIFLSQEEGYSDAALLWHKAWGTGVFFTSSLLYSIRHLPWYKPAFARAGAVLTVMCLLFAGHFGGALTHGHNYIWQPVLAEERISIPLEEALVFDHVVKPVLQQKCIGCHNAQKLKGRLLLTDSLSIDKGGKSGELLVPGKPELSLLVRRIQLPYEEKKHMPPAGNPQLTDEERTLLYYWIKSGAPFGMKVTALPQSDTLGMTATRFLGGQRDQQEVFPFPAVALESLEELNSNYRVVAPLSRTSPALTVNLYNKDAYTPKMLDELKDIKRQIIAFDAARMPVRNEDLKYIARFENLRKLNLNFTDITGAGLASLWSLKDLRELFVAGTGVTRDDMREFLPGCRKLETIALWNTALSATDIEALREEFKYISFLGGVIDDDRPLIKLNPPRLKNPSPVFGDTILLELFHPVDGVEIRFTLDGSDPDSLTSMLYEGVTVLSASTQVKARAYKRGWLGSEVATLDVYGSRHQPDTVILLSALNRVHPAEGAKTFFDHRLGSFNANSPAWANNWAGFIRNDMELLVRFDTPVSVTSVALNTLIETENFIFPPERIEVWGGLCEGELRLIHSIRPEPPGVYRKPFIKLFDCSFPARSVTCMKIIARPVMKLPAWHKSKNKPALLLVDEILIN